MLRSHAQLAAENLFLRKQLALYLERQVKPRRADDATRLTLIALSRLIDWRQLLTVVNAGDAHSLHRKGFRLFWRWKSRPQGRPRVPVDLRQLIAEMAAANRTWGEERIASELLVKLGIHVSPRTVRRYMPTGSGSKRGPGSQAWSTFMRNHARSVLACDFFVAVTAGFHRLYIFVVLEVGTRRILHWNVTDHPTGEWTAQQFRMVVFGDQPHRFVVHDHDSIYSEGVDRTIAAMGLTVLRTPVRAPQANAFCERLIGTDSARVSGFRDPVERVPPAERPCGVGGALQSRASAHRSWARHPRSIRRLSRTICQRPSDPRRPPRRRQTGPRGLHHEYRLEPMAA